LVKKVLLKLQKAGFQTNIDKYKFNIIKTKFLSFIISINGLEVNSEKIAVLKNWKTLYNLKGVQFFLGFCNFYRRFVSEFGRFIRLLTKLFKKGKIFI